MLATSEETFAIDPAHSDVAFSVRHLMISKVRGSFSDVRGSIVVPNGSSLPTAVEVTIDLESIATGNGDRDAHLRSADFLDVARYSQLSFRSTHIEGSSESFVLRGTLTLHGIEREIELAANFEGRGSDPWGKHRIAYEAHGSISRKDFGLVWNQPLESGGVLVGDDVRIEISVEAAA